MWDETMFNMCVNCFCVCLRDKWTTFDTGALFALVNWWPRAREWKSAIRGCKFALDQKCLTPSCTVLSVSSRVGSSKWMARTEKVSLFF